MLIYSSDIKTEAFLQTKVPTVLQGMNRDKEVIKDDAFKESNLEDVVVGDADDGEESKCKGIS